MFWIIWLALQSGVFITYTVIGSSAAPSVASADSPIWQAAFAPVVISTFIRWVVLPRIKSFQSGFTWFVIGMAMAESACIMGLFVFPAHRDELFLTGAVGIFQFIPFFARSLMIGNGQ